MDEEGKNVPQPISVSIDQSPIPYQLSIKLKLAVLKAKRFVCSNIISIEPGTGHVRHCDTVLTKLL